MTRCTGAHTNTKYRLYRRRRRGSSFLLQHYIIIIIITWSHARTHYTYYYYNMCILVVLDRVTILQYIVARSVYMYAFQCRTHTHTLARWPSRLPFFVRSPRCSVYIRRARSIVRAYILYRCGCVRQ